MPCPFSKFSPRACDLKSHRLLTRFATPICVSSYGTYLGCNLKVVGTPDLSSHVIIVPVVNLTSWFSILECKVDN